MNNQVIEIIMRRPIFSEHKNDVHFFYTSIYDKIQLNYKIDLACLIFHVWAAYSVSLLFPFKFESWNVAKNAKKEPFRLENRGNANEQDPSCLFALYQCMFGLWARNIIGKRFKCFMALKSDQKLYASSTRYLCIFMKAELGEFRR